MKTSRITTGTLVVNPVVQLVVLFVIVPGAGLVLVPVPAPTVLFKLHPMNVFFQFTPQERSAL